MSTPSSAPPDPALLRALRYGYRLPMLLWHLVVHLPLVVVALTPIGAAIKLGSGERLDHRMVRWWQGGLMRVFGFRLKQVGTPRSGTTFFVANHCSWLDITLMHSQRSLSFVAKAEIARWPVIGWLASRAGTIYHQRGSNASLARVAEVMVGRLKQGIDVGAFPEGGTGQVDHVRTFHARIFQTCYDAQVPAQPVALRYVRDQMPAVEVAFRDNENFFANFLRLLGNRGCDAEVHFLEPIDPNPEGRRKMSELARRQIIAALAFTTPDAAGELASDELDALLDK